MRIPRTILSILVCVCASTAVCGTGFAQQFEKPRDLSEAQLFSLSKEIEAYYLDTGELPKTLGDLITDRGTAKWNGPYSKPETIHGQNGLPIDYEVDSEAHYTLTAVDKDGKRISRSSKINR